MGILWWRKPKKKDKFPICGESEIEKPKTMEELIQVYYLEKTLLSHLVMDHGGNIPDDYCRRLREIEEKIISLLPDEFQKSVFRILARHKFDIVDFLEKQDWQQDFQKICQDICYFLYYGSPYPQKPEWPPLPIPGNEFFFWLLTQAKTGEKKNRISNVFSTLTSAVEKSEPILGHVFTKDDVFMSLGMRLMVIFAGEMAKQTTVLIDILCDLKKPGEDFIRKLLGLKESHPQ